jgi:hypothetical protein
MGPSLPRTSLTHPDPLIMGKGSMALPLITVFRVWSRQRCFGDPQVSNLELVCRREIRVHISDGDGRKTKIVSFGMQGLGDPVVSS